ILLKIPESKPLGTLASSTTIGSAKNNVFVLDVVDLAKDPVVPVDGNSGEFHYDRECKNLEARLVIKPGFFRE
ncbi:MAG TPA: hypothetical protein DIT89_11245, partial [Planctomycetaceae bacterium]|nr:hypothetical protein [Planctomycetaceae bacterium]